MQGGLAQAATNSAIVNSVGSVVVTSMLPGVDPWLVMFSFFGALLFVVSSKELSLWQRLMYLPIATVGGYAATDEIAKAAGFTAAPIAAFFGGLLIIGIALRLVSRMQSNDTTDYPRKR